VPVDQQGADATEAPFWDLLVRIYRQGRWIWRPCGRRGQASFLHIWVSTSAWHRRGEVTERDDFGAPGGDRSSLLTSLEAHWHDSPRPLPRPTVSSNVLGCLPFPDFLLWASGGGAVYVIFLPEDVVKACLHRLGRQGRF
jgi:hypothetical protein